MRCSVCGRNSRFHRDHEWALQKRNGMGKWETITTAHTNKCAVIRAWQNQLIYGGTMRIWKVPQAKQVPSPVEA